MWEVQKILGHDWTTTTVRYILSAQGDPERPVWRRPGGRVSGWRSIPGGCRLCGRVWLVNADGLCRPCVGEIQESDAAWYFDPPPGLRPVQLVFILPGLRLPHRMPFGSYRARSDARFHPPPWARTQLPADVLDDPRFCPPVLAGQLPLFAARRTLTVADARKIRDRVLTGWQQAEPVLAAYAAEREYGRGWPLTMAAVLRGTPIRMVW